MFFCCVRVSRACCSKIAGLWGCHIVLDRADGVLMLAVRHLVVPDVSSPAGIQGELWARNEVQGTGHRLPLLGVP